METPVSRRQLLATGVAGAIVAPATVGRAAEATAQHAAPGAKPVPPAFRYCLNTATLRGQKLSITELVAIAHRAGYQGIEPWIDELDRLVAAGGSLPDLRKRIADAGLTIEGAIGFAQWCVDDPAVRQKGLEEARRTMGLVAEIGGARIAAPPAGATDKRLDPRLLAERYAALLEVGEEMGVMPMAELWGGSQTMNRLGEVAQIAIESGHSKASILPDIYHLYKGGSGYTGLALLGSHAVPVLHMNDYPSVPARGEITDAARVYPGDGVAPWGEIVAGLRTMGFAGALSLELFNRDYWQQDPLGVALTGLAKMKAVMENIVSRRCGKHSGPIEGGDSFFAFDQGGNAMDMEGSYICDSCGEEIVIPVDLSAGQHQEYVEDCPVCCHPNVIVVECDSSGNVMVAAMPE